MLYLPYPKYGRRCSMSAINVRSLGQVSFPGGEGMFAMLACYLDDSGTHKASRVMVWGGLVGHIDFFAELESAWKAVLNEPCEGRPPIEAFHSTDLAASRGEFEGYSTAERDLTRYNFRKAIVDSGVTAVVFAISIEDWDRIMAGRIRQFVGDPERWLCGEAIASGVDLATKESLPISFQFDIERKSDGVDHLIRVATDYATEKGVVVNVGFSPVKKTPCLQAADMVAHQSYQQFVKLTIDPNAKPDAHMTRLMEDAFDWGVVIFHAEILEEMARHTAAMLDVIEEQVRKTFRDA
jgi:hypothetical protein